MMMENTSRVRFSSDKPSKIIISDKLLSKVPVNDVKLPSDIRHKHKLYFKVTKETQGEKKSELRYMGMLYMHS